MIKSISLFMFFFFLSFSSAYSFSAKSFEKNSFKKAQEQGKTILVDVYADWCSTCKKQHKDLQSLFETPEFKNVVTFQVNYDDKDLVQTFSQTIEPLSRGNPQSLFLKEKNLSHLRSQIPAAS